MNKLQCIGDWLKYEGDQSVADLPSFSLKIDCIAVYSVELVEIHPDLWRTKIITSGGSVYFVQGDCRLFLDVIFLGKAEPSMCLTIRDAQRKQPWTVPYSRGVVNASTTDIPHILATHCVLHASKSVGKLATVFEEMDHPARPDEKGFGSGWGSSKPTDDQLKTIKDMSADLMTAALRFANLYGFNLEIELRRRVKEKNGVDL